MNKKTTNPIIEVVDLKKAYPQTKTIALDGISVSIPEGELVCVKGPSGSGKSTMLNIVAGLIPPTSGEVFFKGEPLLKIRNMSLFRRRNIGFVFQDFYLYPGFSVLENIMLPVSSGLFVDKDWFSRADELLKYLGMEKKRDQNVNTLSAGERQRACIARALLSDPGVVLADEPTGCLDSKNAKNVLALLRDINKERCTTVIIVTHDAQVAEYCNRQIEIVDGRIKKDK